MPRRLIRQFTARLQPAVDRLTSNPTVRRFAPALADPDLWHLNRRSTARAVAIGLFCGLIPGPLQVLSAVIVCLWIRSNLPLTIITTFYTNPLTIVPLYLVAYEYGRLFFPKARAVPPAFHPPADGGLIGFLPALGEWMMSLGKPLAVGIVLLAATLSALGWIAVRIGWRWHVVRAWQRRAGRRR
jgi:uncharacterized protein (DUF2062 family)